MKNLIIILASSLLVSGISGYKEVSAPPESRSYDLIAKECFHNDRYAHHNDLLDYSVHDVSYYMSDGSFFIRRGNGQGRDEYIYVPVGQ